MNDSVVLIGATVIFCTLRQQFWTRVAVPSAATLRDAILSSNLLPQSLRANLDRLDICVSGVPTALGAPVATGVTIEVYDRSPLVTIRA